MPDDGIRLGGRIALALDGNAVQQARSLHPPEAAQGADDLVDVVAVHRPEVAQPQGLEEIAAAALDEPGFDGAHAALETAAHAALAERFPDIVLDAVVAPAGGQMQQIVVQGPAGRVDALVVVVQENQDVGVALAGIVQALESESAGQGAVADQGRHLVAQPLHARRFRQPERRRDGRGRMARAESVVGTLGHLRKAAGTVLGTQTAERLPPAGQDFMGIGLVSHVEDDLVLRRVEDVMIPDNEFHRTQARTQVARALRAALHHIVTDLRTEGAEFVYTQ